MMSSRIRLTAIVVGAVALAALALGGASASSGKVYGIKDCTRPEVRPPRIVLACGDVGLYINAIDYRSWGAQSVHATGVMHARTCNPQCVGSPYKDYPVKFRLYKLG